MVLFWDYLYFNIKNGELESEVHGKKVGMLKENDYESLRQCATLHGKKFNKKRYETSFKHNRL
jgi:vacuolar-type H+-ATPase subunit C/Vma6